MYRDSEQNDRDLGSVIEVLDDACTTLWEVGRCESTKEA